VRRAAQELNITYPIALDNDYTIWKAFGNKYWPSDYLIDAAGKVRYHHFGEGKYAETEKHIQELLKEQNGALTFADTVKVTGTGAQAPPDTDVQSPETYIGYDRADNFLSSGGLRKDIPFTYAIPEHLELNQWALSGNWTDGAQIATLNSALGKIVYRFHARDVHLVLGVTRAARAIRFRVRLDGKEPGANHGVDIDAQGNGTIREHRLYQLIRQQGTIDDRTVEIEFLDSGVQAFAFTFG
jgi:hypothetical protein